MKIREPRLGGTCRAASGGGPLGWWAVGVVMALTVVGVVVLVMVRAAEAPDRSTVTLLPDPSSLRYPEPLPDDAVVFVNDLSLPPPVVQGPIRVPEPAPQPGQRQAEFVLLARAMGASDDWATAELENRGIYVFDELVDEWSASGLARRVFVEHGPNQRVVLYQFDRPLTEQRFIAFAAYTLLRPIGAGLPDDLELGDTAIVGRHGYIELLSPVDVVSVTFAQPSIEMLLDVASADELDAAFDGTIDAPPRPDELTP